MGCSASKQTAEEVHIDMRPEVGGNKKDIPPATEKAENGKPESAARDANDEAAADAPPAAAAAPAASPATAVEDSFAKKKFVDQARIVAAKVKDQVATGGAAAARHFKNNIFARPLDNPATFEAPVFPKSSAQRKFIAKALSHNIFFSGLAQTELQVLLDAFEQIDVESEAFIIRQNDVGDYFYVLMDGECTFWVNESKVGSAKAGDCFGELALLYTSPRAASVQAETNCILFRVDQTTFRYILQTQTLQAEQEKRELLGGVPFFEELDIADLNKVIATMRPHPFQEGDYLVKRGEEGDVFYIIQEGKVKICDICVGTTTYPDQTLGPGDFFGERALVTKEPRIANCIALTKGVAFVIDKATFETVLGSLARLALKSQDKRLLAGVKVIGDNGLDATDLASLAGLIVDESFDAGVTIIQQGKSTAAALYLVREGKVQVTKSGKVTEIVAGGYFGDDFLSADSGKSEVNLASSSTVNPTYSVKCIEKVSLGVLTLEECRSVVDTTQFGRGKRRAISASIIITSKTSIQLENLQRHKLLGHGTFGRVWLVSTKSSFVNGGASGGASEGNSKLVFALKVQSKFSLLENRMAKSVIQERDIMATLQHPFIIQMIQSYQDDTYVYMLLKLVQGGELFNVLNRGKSHGVPEPQAKFYAACIFEGLNYMHRRKILYRDVKPENVLISNQGYPVIVDLGFAKVVSSKTYTLCGTPLYIAPEVILNRGHDKGADHWSFGILVFEMIAGYTPFDTDDIDQITLFRHIIKGKFAFPKKGVMTDDAEDLVERLLVTNPSRRLGSLAKGERDIYEHEWFQDIRFDKLKRREVKAPWIPDIKDPLDASNFETWDERKFKEKYPALTAAEQKVFETF